MTNLSLEVTSDFVTGVTKLRFCHFVRALKMVLAQFRYIRIRVLASHWTQWSDVTESACARSYYLSYTPLRFNYL